MADGWHPIWPIPARGARAHTPNKLHPGELPLCSSRACDAGAEGAFAHQQPSRGVHLLSWEYQCHPLASSSRKGRFALSPSCCPLVRLSDSPCPPLPARRHYAPAASAQTDAASYPIAPCQRATAAARPLLPLVPPDGSAQGAAAPCLPSFCFMCPTECPSPPRLKSAPATTDATRPKR